MDRSYINNYWMLPIFSKKYLYKSGWVTKHPINNMRTHGTENTDGWVQMEYKQVITNI